MPALTSMRQYIDEIATNIMLGYIYELLKINDELPMIKSPSDIKVTQDINIDKGVIVYHLKGTLGDSIHNPDVEVSILPDLLRGLRRGSTEQKRHIRNIPTPEEIEPLVIKNYTTTRLLGIGNKYRR